VAAVNNLPGPAYTPIVIGRAVSSLQQAGTIDPTPAQIRERVRSQTAAAAAAANTAMGGQVGATAMAQNLTNKFTAALTSATKRRVMDLATSTFRSCFTNQVSPGSSADAAQKQNKKRQAAGGVHFKMAVFVAGMTGAITGVDELGGLTPKSVANCALLQLTAAEIAALAQAVYHYASGAHAVQGPLLAGTARS
jgi:hypothetical protein